MAEIDDLINELEKARKRGITEVYFGTDIEGNRICMGFSAGIEEGEESIIIYPDTHGEYFLGKRLPENIIQRLNLIECQELLKSE